MQNAPGAGPLAAQVTASAAELLAKLARGAADTWAEAGAVAAQAQSLHDRAAPLGEQASRAYEEALAAAGSDHEVGEAYARAAEPPLRIAETAADVAALAALVARNGDPAHRADAVVAALLAAGCARAAAELVAANLTASANDDLLRRAVALAEEAARTAEEARAARE
jgi:formiminotetrahydrofolate cyclodeaminase